METQELKQNPAIRVVLLPRDTNSYGTIFGGIILSYIDLAGAVEAGKITALKMVTVAMKEVVFKQPVRVGEVASFYACIKKIGHTSISVNVDVTVLRNGEEVYVTEAALTYVCIDENGKPTPVIVRPNYCPQ